MDDLQSSKKLAVFASYAGAALFAVLMGLFNAIGQGVAVPTLLMALIAVTFHVLLFPVVAELPTLSWARAAGYGWLVTDIVSSIMQLNGVDQNIAMPLRLGGHISSGIWVVVTSFRCNPPMKVVGILYAIILMTYSFAAPWVPMWALYPSVILLIIWLILSGRMLSKTQVVSLGK